MPVYRQIPVVWRKFDRKKVVGQPGCGNGLALPVEPRELEVLRTACLIQQDPFARNRESGLIPSLIADFRNNRCPFAAELQALPVKRLRDQCAVVHEQQRGRMPAQSRSVCRAGVGGQEHFRAARF
jgi:hypothetical protein